MRKLSLKNLNLILNSCHAPRFAVLASPVVSACLAKAKIQMQVIRATA
jgi:hypothetical protein